ncbi:MAG: glycosyltransferase [Deltaproteobacteria bacterium]|nr:MAG: glycosyltransferase [Deltaproteobacteria bacterium]
MNRSSSRKGSPERSLGINRMDTCEDSVFDCSVIIPSYNSERTIRPCLDSVFGQKTSRRYEVWVADSSDDQTPEIIQNEYPGVKLIRFPRKTNPGTARNAAVRVAKGKLLLFTDSDCILNPDWVELMSRAHRENDDSRIVGGAVVNGNPKTLSSTAGYLIEFSEYLPTMAPSVVPSLPTCNISYRREIFELYGGYDPDLYPQEDYFFHWRISQAGEKIRFHPEIRVRHFHRETLRGYFSHNFRFGIVTARVLKVTNLPGAFFVRRPSLAFVFLPFLPMIKFARTCARIVRYAPWAFRRPLVFPLILLGLLYWQAGFAQEVYRRKKGRHGF